MENVSLSSRLQRGKVKGRRREGRDGEKGREDPNVAVEVDGVHRLETLASKVKVRLGLDDHYLNRNKPW